MSMSTDKPPTDAPASSSSTAADPAGGDPGPATSQAGGAAARSAGPEQSPAKSAEKSAASDQPAEKPAAKPEDKAAADQPAEKPAAKPEAKAAADRPAEKPAVKPEAKAPVDQSPAAGVSKSLASTQVRSAFARLALGASGIALLLGFFMPWVDLGAMVSVSGFDLMVSQGQMIALLSGPYRMLLLAVPVAGALLLLGAVTGHRASLWVALLTGLLVLGYGTVTLVRLFLETTGLGLWIVIGAAFLSFGLSLVTLGRRLRG